jgi:bifunctional ADP-heptose synthase (sugar kinase/adenylyltransferase)
MLEVCAKVKAIEELIVLVDQAKAKGLRVVHCHGVFNFLHAGYIRHLQAARRAGDLLVVTLVPDKYANNGGGTPALSEHLRAEAVAALQAVDYVAVSPWPTAAEAIINLRPHLYAVAGGGGSRPGGDPAGTDGEIEAVRMVGGEIYATGQVASESVEVLNNHYPALTPEVGSYLKWFRSRYSAEQVIEHLQSLRSLRVLVLGDIIIDEYHYCKAMGKSSKAATLTARFLSSERHAGGVLAVANHVAGYAGEVHLLTYLGDPVEEEAFVRGHLKPNVQVHLVRQPGRPTVVKRRYVDPFQIAKMFEVCWLDNEEPEAAREAELLGYLERLLSRCDLVVVADFGHGSMGSRTIEFLAGQPAFLAVNAQTNSANFGFNLITKYPRADYICIDEEEMRLANHSRRGLLADLVARTGQRMSSQVASVTQGARGALTWTPAGGVVHTPAFSSQVVDSVGAGDAYLSVTALCARAGYRPELIGFIGNCVGALAVRIVGNRPPVEPGPLYEFIATLLRR